MILTSHQYDTGSSSFIGTGNVFNHSLFHTGRFIPLCCRILLFDFMVSSLENLQQHLPQGAANPPKKYKFVRLSVEPFSVQCFFSSHTQEYICVIFPYIRQRKWVLGHISWKVATPAEVSPQPNAVVFCVQSQWLVAVQLGAGEDLPADRWNLQMRPGVPTHPPQGNFLLFV